MKWILKMMKKKEEEKLRSFTQQINFKNIKKSNNKGNILLGLNKKKKKKPFWLILFLPHSLSFLFLFFFPKKKKKGSCSQINFHYINPTILNTLNT